MPPPHTRSSVVAPCPSSSASCVSRWPFSFGCPVVSCRRSRFVVAFSVVFARSAAVGALRLWAGAKPILQNGYTAHPIRMYKQAAGQPPLYVPMFRSQRPGIGPAWAGKLMRMDYKTRAKTVRAFDPGSLAQALRTFAIAFGQNRHKIGPRLNQSVVSLLNWRCSPAPLCTAPLTA